MSEPVPPQRGFSSAHATFPAPAGRAAAAVALVHAASTAVGVAIAPALVGPPRQVAALTAFLLVLNGGASVLYWQLSRWLLIERGYRGAEPYLRLAAGIMVVDLVVRGLALHTTGVIGIATVQVFGPYSILVGYPYLQHFALGTVLIALGYSLLRIPERDDLLGAYAIAVIASGMAHAAFLAHLSFVPGIASDLLLARLFWGPVLRPAVRTRRVGMWSGSAVRRSRASGRPASHDIARPRW